LNSEEGIFTQESKSRLLRGTGLLYPVSKPISE
jgi:hypothetical protein